MRTVHKYEVISFDPQIVMMPKGAIIRYVGQQEGSVCLWAEVDSDGPMEARLIYVVGTGKRIMYLERSPKYLGTVQVQSFVWHVYELDNT